MATVTKAKKSRAKSLEPKAKPTTHNKPNGEPCDWVERMLNSSPKPQAPSLPVTREIDVDLIEPSPYQPRREFDQAELERMAEEIGEDGCGLIHAIRVRPRGNGYELIAGERRLRAAKLAGCRTIRAEVGEMSDDDAELAVLRENEARKPLNPIERALWIRAHRVRTGQSQAETGRLFGHDQSWVSSHESLLKLPEPAQALVMSGDIPLHAAKQLFGVAAYPAICIAAAKACQAKDGTPATPEDVRDALGEAAGKHARCVAGHYDHKRGRSVPPLKLTEETRKELGVVKLANRWGGEQEYATNVALYDRLLAEQEAKQAAREEKREAAAKKKQKQAPKDPAKAREAAAKFAKRLWGFFVDWNRYAIAKELRSGHVPYEIRLLLVVEAAGTWEHKRWTPDGTERFAAKEILCRLIGDAGGKVPGRNGQEDLGRGLETVAEAEVETLAERYLAAYFCQDDWPCGIVPEDRVLRIADWLDIDLGVLWADEQCGPLSEQYWGLHTKEQLEELGRELNVSLDGAAKRADMIQRFLDYQPAEDDDANTAAAKALPLPKELRKPARPK